MKGGWILLILVLFLAGCSQQIVCNKPYIQKGADCCLDKNANLICDADEVPAGEPVVESAQPVEEYTLPVEQYVPEEPVEEPVPEETAGSAYSAPTKEPEPIPILWFDQSEYLNLTIDSMSFRAEYKPPVSPGGSDKEVYLEEIELTIKNLAYAELDPEFEIKVKDGFATVIKETMDCQSANVHGCHVLGNDVSAKITFTYNTKLRREGENYNIYLKLKNKDDPMVKNQAEIDQPFNALEHKVTYEGEKYW